MQSRASGVITTRKELQHSACLCGDHMWTTLYAFPPCHVVRCGTCRLMRTWPRPTPAELEAAYQDYAPHRPSGRAQHRRGWRRVWVLPPVRPGARVAELGSGTGRFARWAAGHRGWEVSEIEGLGAAEQWAPASGTYAAVVGWQVL